MFTQISYDRSAHHLDSGLATLLGTSTAFGSSGRPPLRRMGLMSEMGLGGDHQPQQGRTVAKIYGRGPEPRDQ
jgi:hypothetical protein